MNPGTHRLPAICDGTLPTAIRGARVVTPAHALSQFEVPPAGPKSTFVIADHRAQALREGECRQLDNNDLGPDVWRSTGFVLEEHVALDVLLELAEEACVGGLLQLEHLSHDALDPYACADPDCEE
jgi:hypothetical protein